MIRRTVSIPKMRPLHHNRPVVFTVGRAYLKTACRFFYAMGKIPRDVIRINSLIGRHKTNFIHTVPVIESGNAFLLPVTPEACLYCVVLERIPVGFAQTA